MKFPLNIKKDTLKAPDSFLLDPILDYIKTLREGRYTISIERVRAKRSLPQNALYHKWIGIIADYCGYLEPEEACKAVKIRLGLCTTQTDRITEGKKWTCPSTADLNVVDMALFMEKVEIWAQDFGINLPSKNQEEP